MTAGNAASTFLLCHFKSITDHLHTTWTGDETTAQCHIMSKHVLNTTVSVFNILPYNGDVDRNTGFGEDGIYTMQCLKYALIGVSIPRFSCSNIHTFYPFTFWGFHGTFEQNPQFFNGALRLWSHTIREAFVKHPFTHFYILIF